MQKAQQEFGFSDREISLIRYSFTLLFYEVSKLILFSIFFYITDCFFEFMFALIPLLILRCRNGGIHVKTYWGCFALSFIYLYLCVKILPAYLQLPNWGIFTILIICACVNFIIGPTSLARKKEKDRKYKHNARLQTFIFIILILLLIVLPATSAHAMISFWTLVLHTLQMAITPKLKEVKYHEKLG